MFDLRVSALLEYIQKACNVVVNVYMRIDEGISDASLGCQMHDPADWLFSKQGCHAFAVRQIHLGEPESQERRKLRKPCFFEAYIVILIEIVQAEHLVTALQQAPSDVVADEARCTGDKNSLYRFGRLHG